MKSIPIALLDHLKSYSTTWCYLMRVQCVGRYDGVVRGFSGLDEPLTYDDGQGALTYMSDNGFMPSQFDRKAAFSVDNAEVTGWVTDDEITERDILAGIFSGAIVTIYRVNYNDLSAGHEVVEHGRFGETKFNENKWTCEFRSLMQQAKQPFGEVYSLTCRAQFGDERCGMPFEWFAGTVTAQGEDNLLEFEASGLVQGDDYFAPGVIEWLTGNNAGGDKEVDLYLSGGLVRLILPMPLQIEVGDTFRIRRDCPKTVAACKGYGNLINMRAEHFTPVADTGLLVPGAYVKQEGA